VQTHQQTDDLARLVAGHSDVNAAWIDQTTNPPTLRILRAPGPIGLATHGPFPQNPTNRALPESLAQLPWDIRPGAPIRNLLCPLPLGPPRNANQACQNEPILLGCQIQPAGAPWVGTAGLPVKWGGTDGRPHWGILSNWHVMCPTPTAKRHPQHQPTDAAPTTAFLTDWNAVTPDAINYLDAAIADAYVDGAHTISPSILGIGPYADSAVDAHVSMHVIKSGRTTQRTYATCSATGAAVKVDYGHFIATFADQDLFQNADEHFSAPGDSGSAILSDPDLMPTAILFAGGGDLTVGCPIRYAIDRFNLQFPFA